jgi:hypothetical protein
LDDDFRYMEADSALLEPVFARRRSSGRGDAPGNAAPSGDDGDADADADAGGGAGGAFRDEPHGGASGSSGRARSGARAGAGAGAGASTTFFAPSAAAAGREHVSVVQGASRGIGLEFVRQLLERTDLRSRTGARPLCLHTRIRFRSLHSSALPAGADAAPRCLAPAVPTPRAQAGAWWPPAASRRRRASCRSC